MPLVVPGITNTSPSSSSSSSQSTWTTKLLGKTLADKHSATAFAKQDLPGEHRVLKNGDVGSLDFNADRLNVHLGDDGIVRRVEFK